MLDSRVHFMTFQFRVEVMAAFSSMYWSKMSPQAVWRGWIEVLWGLKQYGQCSPHLPNPTISSAIKHSATIRDILRLYGLFLQIPLSLPTAALLSFKELKAFLSFTGRIVFLTSSFIMLTSGFFIYLSKQFLIRFSPEERWSHKRQIVLSIWSQSVFYCLRIVSML